MIRLKLSYFGYVIRSSLETSIAMGKVEGKKRGQQQVDRLNYIGSAGGS